MRSEGSASINVDFKSRAVTYLPKPTGAFTMARRPGIYAELGKWYSDYKQNEPEWLEWLEANARHYQSIEDAWAAFAAQRRQNSSFINVETAFRRNK